MGLFDLFKPKKDDAAKAKPAVDAMEAAKAEMARVKAEIDGAYNFLREAGVQTDDLKINFENNSFVLNGTVDDGEALTKLCDVVCDSGSDKEIVNNVELKDWSGENVLLQVKTNGSNLNVRAGTSTKHDIVGKFRNGLNVTLINKTEKDWYKVREGEIEGYCHTNYLV